MKVIISERSGFDVTETYRTIHLPEYLITYIKYQNNLFKKYNNKA